MVGNCLAAAGLSLFAVGCEQKPDIIWAFEARSPDGALVARVENLSLEGPIIGYNETHVTLQQLFKSGDRGAPVDILSFNENNPSDVYVTLHWRDKSHLDMGYKGAHLEFQAVKAFDIEISTHYITN
jgi:hypothetical protein